MAYLGNSPVLSQQEYRNIDNISGSFNGVTTSFALLVNGVAPVPAPQSSNQCLISVNGVVQKPDDTGASGFRISGGNIIFSSAPTGGQSFFGVILAGADYIYAGENFPDGTVSAPSITFAQDTDTGFFRSGAGEIKYTANGTAVVTLSSNNLTAPSFIPTSSSAPTNGVYLPAANTVGISTNGSGRLFINSSGYTSIGNSSPQALVHFGAGTSAPAFGTASSLVYVCTAGQTEVQLRTTVNDVTGSIYTDSNGVNVRAASAHPLSFHTSNTERLRITSAGLVGIGTSSPAEQLELAKGSERLMIGADSPSGYSRIAARNTGNSGYRGFQIDGSDLLINSNTSGNVIVATGGGRVGIGTTSPSGANLVIDTESNSGSGIRLIGKSANDGSEIDFYADNNSTRLGYIEYNNTSTTLNSETNVPVRFFQNGGEAFRVDTSKRVLVGTTSSVDSALIQFAGAKNYSSGIPQNQLNVNDTTSYATGVGGAISFSGKYHSAGFNTTFGSIEGVKVNATDGDYGGALVFRTRINGGNNDERMRIDNVGRLLVGVTSNNPAFFNVPGTQISSQLLEVSGDSQIEARFNRKTSDGGMIEFLQDGTVEGSISVSGTTVSYNGAHLSRWSQLPSGAEREEILRGSVLSNIDEMCEWGDEDNEQLNRMKVSDVEGDKNVSGVFQAWDDDDDTYTNDFYCAMTGDFIIRIAAGVTVERGDLLMSAGDGTAKPQDDDIIRSKTIAKVTSTHVTCTYDDGSYCVPCVLMAC